MGCLTASQLHTYMADIASEVPLLQCMEPSFLPHYVRITVRKLLFFHACR